MRVLLLTLVVLLLAPAGAQAGTLSLETTTTVGSGPHGETEWHYTLRYDAAPGERNVVEARFTGDELTLTDAAGVAATAPCVTDSPVQARCTLGTGRSLHVALGDQDDTAAMHADGLAFMGADGGDGDDHLTVDVDWPNASGAVSGGPGADVLTAPYGTADGGPGDDRLEAAMVTYAGRRGPLVADLAAGTAALPGEHDTLVDVHGLAGSDGDDVISGSPAADGVDGGPGDDRITGLDGNDGLTGGPGDDVMSGGTGDDHLEGGGGADHLDAGEGNDVADGRYGADSILGGPGRDDLDGGSGRDRIDARDGAFDDVDCAAFGDGRKLGRATVDAADLVMHCRTVARVGAPTAVLVHAGSNPLLDPPLQFGTVWIGCSQDLPRGCRGSITSMLPDGTARSHPMRFDVPAQAIWQDKIAVPLTPAIQAIRARCGAVLVRYVLRTRDRTGRMHVQAVDAIEARSIGAMPCSGT